MGQLLAMSPLLRGVAKAYNWKDLEPTQGSYNFSAIKQDLDYLYSLNKKEIVIINSQAWSSGANNVPSYISGATYGGGIYVTSSGAYDPVLWNSNVISRLIALETAFAQQFDSHPALEGVYVVAESAVQSLDTTLNPSVDPYSATAYRDNLSQLATQVRAALPHTMTLIGLNYPAGDTTQDLATWAGKAQTAGFGIAAVDTHLANNTWLAGYSYTYFPTLSGITPTISMVDWDNYTTTYNPTGLVSDIYNYARTTLKASHILWKQRNDPAPGDYFNQVVTMLNSSGFPSDVAGGLSTTCPKVYTSCNSN